MEDMLTVSKAVKLSGKSRSTIRRFYETIAKDDNHPDRKQIQPTSKQLQDFKKNKEPYQWKIARTLIDREFGKKDEHSSKAGAGESRNGVDIALESVSRENELLRDQLKVKDGQIDTANKTIEGLNERVREGNILLSNFTGGSNRVLPAETLHDNSNSEDKPKWYHVRVKKFFS